MNKIFLLIAVAACSQGCANALQEPPHTQWTETDITDAEDRHQAPRRRVANSESADATSVVAGALDGWLRAQRYQRVVTCENFGYTTICREGY